MSEVHWLVVATILNSVSIALLSYFLGQVQRVQRERGGGRSRMGE